MAKRRKVEIEHAEVVRVFAERLREIRLSRGMTQTELARQAGVTATYVSRLEKVGAAPGIDLAERLAKALGTGVIDLLRAPAPTEALPVFHEQARRLFDSLLRTGDREAFSLLNPFLALLVEAAAKRGSEKPT